MHAAADGCEASISSDPDPLYAEKPFTVIVTITADKSFESDVWAWTWAAYDGKEKNPISKWEDGKVDKMKMTKIDNKTFSFTVTDAKTFYGLNEDELAKVEKFGFIARTDGSDQTKDLFVEARHYVNQYSGGEGTVSEPYLIADAADLNFLAGHPEHWGSDIYFKLTADINEAGDFPGIGSMEKPFGGRFDGNHHTISGVNISGTDRGIGSATGFFNALEATSYVRDLGLKDLTVSGVTYVGGLAGYSIGSTIERCYTSGNVIGTSICVGGLVGENDGNISDCYSTANVTSDGDYVAGGLVGKNIGWIERAYASGDVKGHNYVGAVVGVNHGIVLYSVAMNLHITSTNGSMFAGRFGGNGNRLNRVKRTSNASLSATSHEIDLSSDTNLSWSGMNHSQNKWDGLAHHAISADQALGEKATYANTLGWDFTNTWKWVGKEAPDAGSAIGEKRYPVLAGIDGQEAPASEDFYTMTAIGDVEADTAGAIGVFPTAVENTFTVSAPSAIAALQVVAVNGATVLGLSGNGAQSVEVDMEGVMPGVYFLGVTLADGSRTTVRLVKK